MTRVDAEFKERVYELVGRIPEGRLMTYGGVAAFCGAAWAAWEVGQIAHLAPCANLPACQETWQPAGLQADRTDFTSADSLHRSISTARSAARQESARSTDRMARGVNCPQHDIPWQRVVNKQGGLARGYTWGGLEGHKRALESEGLKVSDDFTVDLATLSWVPNS